MIFIPQPVIEIDFEFETTEICESTRPPNIFATDRLLSRVKSKMKDVACGDYILSSGNLFLNVLCGLVMAVNTKKISVMEVGPRGGIKKLCARFPGEVPWGPVKNNKKTVFVLETESRNYDKARDFGRLSTVFTSNEETRVGQESFQICIAFSDRYIGKKDLIIPAGKRALNIALASAAVMKNGHVGLLFYDAKKKDYHIRDFELEAFKL